MLLVAIFLSPFALTRAVAVRLIWKYYPDTIKLVTTVESGSCRWWTLIGGLVFEASLVHDLPSRQESKVHRDSTLLASVV